MATKFFQKVLYYDSTLVGEGQIFCHFSFFLYLFRFVHKKLNIKNKLTFRYIKRLNRNKIFFFQYVNEIQLIKKDKKEYFMCQYSVFYGEYENENKTRQTNSCPKFEF